MITYFIKSGLCLALLLAFYHLVLEREKMHTFNRFYLLGSILFSFLAPLYIIYEYIPAPVIENISPIVIEDNFNNTISVAETPVKEPFNYTSYLIGLYISIASILLIRFCKNLFLIIQKVRKNQQIKLANAKIILVEDTISPHTFWNYIFINKDEYFSEKIENELFTHELTHVTQKHTLDIILIELFQIVFWINPLFIMLKKAIKLNHEFLADTKVIKTHKNTIEYQYLLLNRATWNNEYYLASNLNYVLTKKRLLMMTKQSSRTSILLKKLAVIPLLVGFTFLFAERVEAQETIEKIVEEKTTSSFSTLPKLVDEEDTNENIPLIEEEPIQKSYKFNSDGKEKRVKNVHSARKTSKQSISNKKSIIQKIDEINVTHKTKTPILKIDFKKQTYLLNNRSINIDYIKSEFIKETKGVKSNLKIDALGEVKLSFIRNIYKKITKKYLGEILLINGISFITNDDVSLKTEKLNYQETSNKTAIKKGWIIINNQTHFYVKNSDGSTEYYDRWGNLVDKNGKLLTQNNQQKLQGDETGFITVDGKTIFFVKQDNTTKYYNRWGQEVDKNGKIINPEQTKSNDVIKNQNISKIYKNGKVAISFKPNNLPKNDIEDVPNPPSLQSPPSVISPLDFMKEQKDKNADYFYNGKKINYEKALQFLNTKRPIQVQSKNVNGKMIINLKKKIKNL